MDKHDTLLIACGIPENRQQFRRVLAERYHLLESANTSQTMLLMKQNSSCIAAVVLDISQEEDIAQQFFQHPDIDTVLRQVPVIAICRNYDPELAARYFSCGVSDVIPLDYDPYAMFRRIETIVDLHLHKQYLETMVQEQAEKLQQSNQTMVDVLSSLIEYRSVESGQHILRIRHFTKLLLEEVVRSCPEYGLDQDSIRIISSAAALHDIGKIAIPDAILMKPGPLTSQEMEVMRTHALTGCHILNTLGAVGNQEYLRYAHNICHYHHERWDGGGYPEGLKGDQIPICAQVVGLADAYDALTTKRVYKDALPFPQAVNMILRGSCGVFSPQLLECFKHVAPAFEALAQSYADGASPKAEAFDTTLPAPSRQEDNSMDRVRAKYFALVHYINSLLLEVDLNRDLFHLIYNPYPELSWLEDVPTFSGIAPLMAQQLPEPEDRQAFMTLFHSIPTFIQQDLRRSSHRFCFRDPMTRQQHCYEITLLRTNPLDTTRKTLAILCRRLEEDAYAAPQEAAPLLSGSTLLCRYDQDFTLVQFGQYTRLLAGYTTQELQAQFGGRLLELVIPEDREALLRSYRQQYAAGSWAETELRIRTKSGAISWMVNRSYLSTGTNGQEYLNCFLTDITPLRQEFDALHDKLRRYEIILDQTENVLFEWDVIHDSIHFSDTWEKLFGFPPITGRVGNTLANGAFFHPDDLPPLFDKISNLKNGSHYETAEVRIATAQGRYLWCRFRATAIRDASGKLTGVVGIIINIDMEKQNQRLLQDRADRDSLTKLLNKTAGRKLAEEYLAQYPSGVSCTMLIIDLDNFKQVNDQYGHLFGDAVLTKASREIEKLFRTQDIVARIGGDEFMVLMRGVSDRNLVSSRCQRLLNIFASTFRDSRHKLPLSCSIGIALSGEHGTSYYELFNRADQALYRAKAAGKNVFCFYDPTTDLFPAHQQQATAVNNQIDSDVEPGLAENNIVRYAFQKLYSAQDTDQAINDILALMGQQMNVSRVYIFENTDDNRFCNNTYEWCHTGISPQIRNLQHISYETDIPDYADNFNEQGIFHCSDVATLPRKAYDIVAPQGILSMLHCAIRDNGVFRGFIGFDECVEQRIWTRNQIDTLHYFSEMLSLFLLNHRRREQALIQAQELHTILDNQRGWTYIIDPDSYSLKYANGRVRAFSPQVALGQPCYRAIWGRASRCPGCPAADLRRTGAESTILTDRQTGLPILAEATPISWQGQESCLMTCRRLSEITKV